jgi:glycosyltransferase involved in cell wall biosynthesis
MLPREVRLVHGGFAKIGGIETFAADLIPALNVRRIRVELICWGAGGNQGNPLLTSLSKAGVEISRTGWRWGCRWGWPDSLMVAEQWQRLASAELLIFGKLLHEKAHRRIQSLGKRMILITPYRPAEMWADRSPDREILNSFEAIVVQGRSFGEDLRTLGYSGQVVNLPYLPPATQSPSPWPATRTLQIGFLGRLVPDKNVEYLIHSFSCLREMGVDAHLHIFGDGPEHGALEVLTNRTGVGKWVSFHGGVDRSRIAAAIDSCHLFALGSRTEGQPLASLESLARGRPVVGTPVGSLPEYLCGPLGSIGPLDAPVDFAAAMKAVAEPVLKGELSPEIVQRAYRSRFPRHQVIDEYVRILAHRVST